MIVVSFASPTHSVIIFTNDDDNDYYALSGRVSGGGGGGGVVAQWNWEGCVHNTHDIQFFDE